jgi:DNA-binding NarL/FixJ family response regulator
MAPSGRRSLDDDETYSKTQEMVREAVRAYHDVARDLLKQTSLLVDALERLTSDCENRKDLKNEGKAGSRTLTRRERHVLQLLTEGSTNRVMARDLRISERTVKNHLQSIYGKLGVADRTGAVVKGIKSGLVTW